MAISFNLKSIFLMCLFLMIWHIVLPFTFGIGVLIVLGFLVLKHDKKNFAIIDYLFATSFLFNLWYVLGESISYRQYDYFNFFMHAVFFVENDFFIDNPLMYLKSVFFQPPLWGAITGIIAKFCMMMGKTKEFGFDVARFLSLFAISGVMVLAWRLFSLFKFKKEVLVWGYALFVFLPIHTIMAGFNNNDAFVYFLMTAVIYEGYCWYVSEDIKKSFVIAGILILAGMTKFSGLMVVSYLGMLGIALLVRHKCVFDKKLFIQFGIIAVGSVIGFAWGIFLLYYKFPLVPPPINVSFQLMDKYSLVERLFDFSNIMTIFADVRQGILEQNVWLSLIKTATFGEWSWSGGIWALGLYITMILIALVFVFSFLFIFKYKIGDDFGLNLAIVIFVLAVLISWAMFWMKFPYFCSTEFRYVVALVPVSFLWMMNLFTQKNLPKWLNVSLASLVVIMIVTKAIVCLSTI